MSLFDRVKSGEVVPAEDLRLPVWDRREIESLLGIAPREPSYREQWEAMQVETIRRCLRGESTSIDCLILAQFFDAYDPDRKLAGRMVADRLPAEEACWRNFFRNP